jgi:TonB family protein
MLTRPGSGRRRGNFSCFLLLLALAAPAGIEASSSETCKACICQPDHRRYSLEHRDVVFSGRVIGQRMVPGGIENTFLVLEAWKGVESDVVLVNAHISGNCGAMYSMGETFLVFADERAGRVRTGECDGALGLRGARSLLEELGVPARTLTSQGLDRLDAEAILPGDRITSSGTRRMTLALLVHDENGAVWHRPVRIGDREQVTDLTGRAQFSDLSPGFYKGAVALEEVEHEFRVLLRCEESGNCRRTRTLVRIHEAPPGDPEDFLRTSVTFTPWTDPASLLNGKQIEALIEAGTPGKSVTVGREHDGTVRNLDGTLALWVYVDEEGIVRNVQIGRSSGRDEIDRVVLSAIEKAVFEPAGGRVSRIPVWIQLVVSLAER